MGTNEDFTPVDPSSFSSPESCVVVNIDLNLLVDFEKHVLKGFANLTVEKKKPNVDHVILDIRDIAISKITDEATGVELHFNSETFPHVLNFGERLTVNLPKSQEKRATIRIEYVTSRKASALQWLKPEQTAGKEKPYLFSQCQAVHARSILPCQDTPSVKAPYSAIITVPDGLVALMSAVNEGEVQCSIPGKKSFKFHQKVPIPSYLIALVVGALEHRVIGPRTKVWSEKENIEAAAYEFAETEEMLGIAEKIVGPYVWGVYDLLVLPPSFPFGGMENPCLTFVTPTLLAGDKSLAGVVAHEIAHSWTGNLVTNKTFEHFWLNEGFTVFLERKILGRMHGESFRHFQSSGGWKELQFCIQAEGDTNPLTNLVPDLRGVDPDDSFSTVPYEKGHAFLFYLEQLLGGPAIFEDFFRSYIEEYKYQSVDTATWKAFLYGYFSGKKNVLDQVDWEGWLHKPGMPPVKPNIDTSLADVCMQLCQRWVKADVADLSAFAPNDIKDFSSPQIIEFLTQLLDEKPLPVEKVKKMKELYKFDSVKNSEVRFRWLRFGLLSKWTDIIPSAIEFVVEQGRMKFTRPLYRDLYAWEKTRSLAIETFHKYKNEMMHVSKHTIGKDLHLNEIR